MHFMNEYEIEEAVYHLGEDPVLGKLVRFLRDFKDEVNQHSDGWSYWRAPVAAANQLMTLIESAMATKRGYPRGVPILKISDKTVAKAMRPIKSFMTRRGNAVGMKLPEVL
jgi:hypothetical protein